MSETDETKEPDLPKISRRRKRFAEEYIVNGCTKSEAYRRAFGIKKGWDSQRIADNAYRVYNRPEVKTYIAHLQKEIQEEYEARKARVLRTQYLLSIGDIETLATENGSVFREAKVSDINEATKNISRMLGWMSDNVDLNLNAPPPVINIAPYPDADEAEAEARAAVSRHTTAT